MNGFGEIRSVLNRVFAFELQKYYAVNKLGKNKNLRIATYIVLAN